MKNQTDICCTLNPDEFQERKILLLEFSKLIQKKSEIETGYIFELRGSDTDLNAAVKIIQTERKCCSFLTFELFIQKDGEPILLKITGPEGTKDFILYEMGLDVQTNK